MKFAQYLKLVDAGSPAVFRGSYLHYKGLKKFIKYRGRRMQQAHSEEKDTLLVTAEREIREMLCTQLRTVDRCSPGRDSMIPRVVNILHCTEAGQCVLAKLLGACRQFEAEAKAILAKYDRLSKRQKSKLFSWGGQVIQPCHAHHSVKQNFKLLSALCFASRWLARRQIVPSPCPPKDHIAAGYRRVLEGAVCTAAVSQKICQGQCPGPAQDLQEA